MAKTDPVVLGFTPLLLRRPKAAAYLDMSPSLFDDLVKQGRLPQPKIVTPGCIAWDTNALRAAVEEMPEKEPPARVNSFEDKFR